MKEARIIRADGTEEKIVPANGTDFNLDEAQKVVGGLIEIVNLKNGKIIVCNEEGLFLQLAVNVKATNICNQHHAIRPGSVIVGDVLYCDTDMIR